MNKELDNPNYRFSIKPERKRFMGHFAMLMFTAFVLFFITVGIGKVSADFLIYMNDQKSQKSTVEWMIFAIGAPIATAVWCIIWLWFKKSEKQCIELMSEVK